MGEAPYDLLFVLLHVVVPAWGLFVAGMLAVKRVTVGAPAIGYFLVVSAGSGR